MPICSIDGCDKKSTSRKLCRNHYMQQYRAIPENKNKVKQLWNAWHDKNKDKYSKKKKELRQKKEYKDRVRVYVKNKYHNDVNFRISYILRSGLVRGINCNQRAGSAIRNLGCSMEDFKNHLESKFKEGMSWENWSKDGWHIDHIVPLSSFDLSDPEQLRKACHYTNLQPLWASDNIRKGKK